VIELYEFRVTIKLKYWDPERQGFWITYNKQPRLVPTQVFKLNSFSLKEGMEQLDLDEIENISAGLMNSILPRLPDLKSL
jgi:hypothetical protein